MLVTAVPPDGLQVCCESAFLSSRHQSGQCCPSPRSSRSPTPSLSGIARSCCWPPLRACDGANYARSASQTSTWRRGQSASNAPSLNSRTGRWHSGRPSPMLGGARSASPKLIAPVVREHLSRFARPEDDGLVFTGPTGALLRRGNFRRRTWLPALKKAGLPVVHFHDLRHTGNNLTATSGANLRELMARMGHSSTRAALIYLHSTDERQREIADALGDVAAGELKRKQSRARKGITGSRSGTQRAQRRKSAS